jgi:hypothetical protein
MKSFISSLTCLSLIFFTIGCYTLDAVKTEEKDTIKEDEQIINVTKRNGEVIEQDTKGVAMIKIEANGIIVYMTNGAVKIVPLEEVESIATKKFSIPDTISLIVVSSVVLFGVAALIVFSKVRVGG